MYEYSCVGDDQYHIMIIPTDKSAHSFSCKYTKDRAVFFVAPVSAGSVQQHTTDIIIPLCFQCYVRKRRWIGVL